MTLSYDMTFVVILLTSLYESETAEVRHRCKVHPVKKQSMLQNEASRYGADMNLILTYYHLEDDWEDEKKPGALAGMLALKKRVKKTIARYPRQAEAIKRELAALARYEAAGSTVIDEPAGCFGRLMGEILVWREDVWADRLRSLGFFLGKYIYIMDAYEDLEKDKQEGCYNPLLHLSKEPDYEERCRKMLLMMMGECTAQFERLPCILDVDILRNILYDGVWNRYQKIQDKKEKREELQL